MTTSARLNAANPTSLTNIDNLNQQPITFKLPIHHKNVGLVLGKGGATIKRINENHVGWADAHLEKNTGTIYQNIIINGHPIHVSAIAVEITEIAMEAKHRNQMQLHENSSTRSRQQTMRDFILKPAPRSFSMDKANQQRNSNGGGWMDPDVPTPKEWNMKN